MHLDPTEILYLSKESWGASIPAQPSPQHKGQAIDYDVKATFGDAATEYAPYDMKFKVQGCTYHEVKSSTTKWIKISPNEMEHAQDAWAKGQDTLFWAYEQLEARDEYRFFAIAKYSRIQNFIYPSKHSVYNVKRGEAWVQEYGFAINKYDLRDHGESTE